MTFPAGHKFGISGSIYSRSATESIHFQSGIVSEAGKGVACPVAQKLSLLQGIGLERVPRFRNLFCNAQGGRSYKLISFTEYLLSLAQLVHVSGCKYYFH